MLVFFITRGTLGLSHAQATQACSSHIVVDLADLARVPVKAISHGEDQNQNLCA